MLLYPAGTKISPFSTSILYLSTNRYNKMGVLLFNRSITNGGVKSCEPAADIVRSFRSMALPGRYCPTGLATQHRATSGAGYIDRTLLQIYNLIIHFSSRVQLSKYAEFQIACSFCIPPCIATHTSRHVSLSLPDAMHALQFFRSLPSIFFNKLFL